MNRIKTRLVQSLYFLGLFSLFQGTKIFLRNNSTAEFLALNSFSKTLNKSLPEIISGLKDNITVNGTSRNFFDKEEDFTLLSSEKPIGPPVFMLEFGFEIEDFLLFEPMKMGYVEVGARLTYKWWNRNNQQSGDRLNLYQPVIRFQETEHAFKNNIEVNDKVSRFKIQTREDSVFDSKYAAFEQNVTIKFKCQSSQSQVALLDTSRFPFDSHICNLDLSLDMKPLGAPKTNKLERNSVPTLQRPKITIANENLVSNYLTNKLVLLPNSNKGMLTRDWILKRFSLMFTNSSIDQNHRSLMTMQDETAMNVKLVINRRREPQIFMFVLPLCLFTCITFLVFLMPTSNSSEKTLMTFANLISLLLFNVYLFRTVVYTYEFVSMPQILQYSNCLMVLQLVVFVYISMAKSIYQHGMFSGTERASKEWKTATTGLMKNGRITGSHYGSNCRAGQSRRNNYMMDPSLIGVRKLDDNIELRQYDPNQTIRPQSSYAVPRQVCINVFFNFSRS